MRLVITEAGGAAAHGRRDWRQVTRSADESALAGLVAWPRRSGGHSTATAAPHRKTLSNDEQYPRWMSRFVCCKFCCCWAIMAIWREMLQSRALYRRCAGGLPDGAASVPPKRRWMSAVMTASAHRGRALICAAADGGKLVLQSQEGGEALVAGGAHHGYVVQRPDDSGVMQHKPMHDLRITCSGAMSRCGTHRQPIPGCCGAAQRDGIMMMIRMYKAMSREDKELQIAGRNCGALSASRIRRQRGGRSRILGANSTEGTGTEDLPDQASMSAINFDDTTVCLTAELLKARRALISTRIRVTLGAGEHSAKPKRRPDGRRKQRHAAAVLELGNPSWHWAKFSQPFGARRGNCIDSLLQETDPRCALDVLWVIGGYFAKPGATGCGCVTRTHWANARRRRERRCRDQPAAHHAAFFRHSARQGDDRHDRGYSGRSGQPVGFAGWAMRRDRAIWRLIFSAWRSW
jgi:hypothetical protein